MYYYYNKCHRTYQNVLYICIYYSSRHPSIDDGGGSAKTPACNNYLLADKVHDGDDEKPAESGVL
jgi:hypothetical protein